MRPMVLAPAPGRQGRRSPARNDVQAAATIPGGPPHYRVPTSATAQKNRPVVLAVTVESEAEQIADALVAASESIRIREVFESRES